jgi:hypothetical protein
MLPDISCGEVYNPNNPLFNITYNANGNDSNIEDSFTPLEVVANEKKKFPPKMSVKEFLVCPL